MSPFDGWTTLDDPSLLSAVRDLFAPGAPEPDLRALCGALAGRDVMVPVPGGRVRVDLGDWTSILLVRLGVWEPHLARLAAAVVRPGDVAVDVGAHVGTWTVLLASLVGAHGCVVAFEPSPVSAARASEAVRSAGVDEWVHVVQAAVGDRPGHAPMYEFTNGSRYPGVDAMLRSLVLADGYAASTAVDVEVTTLDAAGINTLDFLKIDVEGFELSVLRGARALLNRSTPTLLMELHEEQLLSLGLSHADVFSELGAHGFTVFDIRPEGAAVMLRPLAAGASPTTHHVLARRDASPFDVALVP